MADGSRREKRIMNDWMVERPKMFYICKEKGEQCPHATEYGYCQITACINHYREAGKEE